MSVFDVIHLRMVVTDVIRDHQWWRCVLKKLKIVSRKDEPALIEILRVEKGYGAKRLTAAFPTKQHGFLLLWTVLVATPDNQNDTSGFAQITRGSGGLEVELCTLMRTWNLSKNLRWVKRMHQECKQLCGRSLEIPACPAFESFKHYDIDRHTDAVRSSPFWVVLFHINDIPVILKWIFNEITGWATGADWGKKGYREDALSGALSLPCHLLPSTVFLPFPSPSCTFIFRSRREAAHKSS